MTPRHARLSSLLESTFPTDDLAHDRLHVMRVFAWAVRLAPDAGADADLAGAAALVHDLVNVPKEAADRHLGGEQSATAAAPLLLEAGYTDREVEAITTAVRRSSWSRGLPPETPLDRVLQDADRLDAIGAIGVARTFATAQAMVGRGKEMTLYHEPDALARDRAVDDGAFALDHFRAKLLQLAEGLHLPAARAEARRRHAFMQAFLRQLEEDLKYT
jgi:uncharacterized protein